MSKALYHKIKLIFKSFWLENDLINPPLWLVTLTTIALFSFAFFAMIHDPVGKYSLRLLALGGLVVWFFYGAQLRTSGTTWFFLTAIAIPLVSWGFAHINHPLWAEASPKIHRLTNWFLFIPIAVILGGRTKNVTFLFLLALCGVLIAGLVSGISWQEWLLGFKGLRIDFGLHNAQHASLLYGTCLLGLMSFVGRFIGPKGFWRFPRIVMWVAAFLFCLFAVIFSQSRGIWLGLIGASALYVPLILFYSQVRKRNPRRFWLIVVIAVVAGFSLVWSLNSMNSIVTNRLTAESGTIQRFLAGDTSDLESTSIGIRLISWSTAWPWIEEHPLVGWGGKGRRLIMEYSGIPGRFGHLHNSYIDLMVSYGLFGVLLFFFLIGWLLKKSFFAWRGGSLPSDFLSFFCLFIIFWLIVNFFESYMFFSSGIYIFNIVCGGILTHIWHYDYCAKKS